MKGSLPVDKDIHQPEQFPVDAAGRGDDCRQEGVTKTFGRVASLECGCGPEHKDHKSDCRGNSDCWRSEPAWRAKAPPKN